MRTRSPRSRLRRISFSLGRSAGHRQKAREYGEYIETEAGGSPADPTSSSIRRYIERGAKRTASSAATCAEVVLTTLRPARAAGGDGFDHWRGPDTPLPPERIAAVATTVALQPDRPAVKYSKDARDVTVSCCATGASSSFRPRQGSASRRGEQRRSSPLPSVSAPAGASGRSRGAAWGAIVRQSSRPIRQGDGREPPGRQGAPLHTTCSIDIPGNPTQKSTGTP